MEDALSNRMKIYEAVPKTRLIRRTPVILRIDGCHFHSYARGFEKPFDEIMSTAMVATAQKLCKNIQGATFAYTQSDEISILLIDYKRLESEAWFDNQVEKICSVAASMATLYFNRAFNNLYEQKISENIEDIETLYNRYSRASKSGATFDCRCFNLPREEVTNYFYWRQKDAIRNSINACGQAYFSSKQLIGKSCSEVKNMLLEEGFDWDALPVTKQRGTMIYYGEIPGWYATEPPIFKGEQGRYYIETLLNPDREVR